MFALIGVIFPHSEYGKAWYVIFMEWICKLKQLNFMKNTILTLAFSIAVSTVMFGQETAGKKLDKAVDKTEQATKKAAHTVKKGVKKTSTKVKHSVHKTAKKVEEKTAE
jgi:hypothetical protein